VALNLFDRNFSEDFLTREDWSTECVDLVSAGGLVFFTDGSFCGGRAGAGVFSEILNIRELYALGTHAMVFQSEVYDIMAFAEYCISEDIVNRAISDSRAALLAHKSYAVSSRPVLQCEDSFQELGLSNRVQMVWVPGHCGIHGNEETHLQEPGSSSTFVGPKPCLPLATSIVKRKEREWLLKSHCLMLGS
jgi:hypothetical protein